MTKYLITLFVLSLITSCDDSSASNNSQSKKNEPQTLLSKKEQLAHDFENNKLTNPFDFYTGVVAEFSLIQMHLVGILKLIDRKATLEEIIEEAKKGGDLSSSVLKKLKKIKAIGVDGSTLLTNCSKYAESSRLVFNDIVENNGALHDSNISTLISIESTFIACEETYASKNNIKLGANVDIGKMYEESTKTENKK